MSLRMRLITFCIGVLFLATPVAALNIEDSLVLGVDKSEAGDYRGALIEFNKAIDMDPNNARAYQYRGVAKRDMVTLRLQSLITTKPSS